MADHTHEEGEFIVSLEEHLNADHGFRLNNLMGMMQDEKLALHREQHKAAGFEAAVRRLLGVDATWTVHVTISGGDSVQIGDYTWDTNPHEFEVWAAKDGNTKARTFTDFSECMNALLDA